MSTKEIVGEPVEEWVGARPIRHKLSEIMAGTDENIVNMNEGMADVGNWSYYRQYENMTDTVAQVRKMVSLSPALIKQVPPAIVHALAHGNVLVTESGKIIEEVYAHQYVWGWSRTNLTGWVHEPTYSMTGWRLSPEEVAEYNKIQRNNKNEMQTGVSK